MVVKAGLPDSELDALCQNRRLAGRIELFIIRNIL